MAGLLGDERFRKEVMTSHQSFSLTSEDHAILRPLLLKLAKKNGEMVFGLLKSETSDEIIVGVAPGQSFRVPRAKVASVVPVAFSPMPAG